MNKLLDYITKIRNQYAKAFALTIHHWDLKSASFFYFNFNNRKLFCIITIDCWLKPKHKFTSIDKYKIILFYNTE